MTELMVNCALLEIPVDPGRLFDGDDPNFELWLSTVVDLVNSKRREQNRTARSGSTTR